MATTTTTYAFKKSEDTDAGLATYLVDERANWDKIDGLLAGADPLKLGAAATFAIQNSAASNLLTLVESTGLLALPSAGASAGIALGSDVHLYRGAANRLEMGGGDALVIRGGAGDFPSPVNGMLWYNTTTRRMRVYQNGAWRNVA